MRPAHPTRRLILAGAAGAALAPRAARALAVEEERTLGDGPETLTILSTTDADVFAPVLDAFLATRPGLRVRYTVAGTTDLHAAVAGGAAFDLAISSAMDLQMKLANDGHARPAPGPAAWPRWARWRDELWAFAQEPVVTALAPGAFAAPPASRAQLVEALRARPDDFRGRVGTYDPARSGAGYLFATQDARRSDSFWRLAEVMGGLAPRLYASTGAMLRDLAQGRLTLAYNVLGSYAGAGPLAVELRDFTHVLLRTALIPAAAPRPDLGARALAFLLSPEGQAAIAGAGLPPIDAASLARAPHLRPIRLDPGLLVYVDPLRRARFLREWGAAIRRPEAPARP